MFKDNESKHNTCLPGIYLAAELFCRKSGDNIPKKEIFYIGDSKGWAQIFFGGFMTALRSIYSFITVSVRHSPLKRCCVSSSDSSALISF